MNTSGAPRSEPPRPSVAGKGVEGCFGCLFLLVLPILPMVWFTVENWVLVTLAASAIVWRKTSAEGGVIGRTFHRLAESWGIALSILAVLEVVIGFATRDEARPFLNAYERTVLVAAKYFKVMNLSWGWLLVVLAVLMMGVILAPSYQPVSAFLKAGKRTGRVANVLTILSSFTFFAASVAPPWGFAVLDHAQAVFDQDLARERTALAKISVVQTLLPVLQNPQERARISEWAEDVGSTFNRKENRDELVRLLVSEATGQMAPNLEAAPPEPATAEPGFPRQNAIDHSLLLANATDLLGQQKLRVQTAETEFDRGFQEILAKTADLPRKEWVGGVMDALIGALGDHPSLTAEVTRALADAATQESLLDRTRPIVQKLVADLRDRFWNAEPSAVQWDLKLSAESIKRIHAKNADHLIARVKELAARAEKRVYLSPQGAKDDVREAQDLAAQAKDEAVRASDGDGEGVGTSSISSNQPGSAWFSDLDARLRALDHLMVRVEEAELRAEKAEARRGEVRRGGVP